VDSSGNVYAAGSKAGNHEYNFGNNVKVLGTCNGHLQIVLVKYDQNGDAQWAKTASPYNKLLCDTVFNSVAVDGNNYVYAAGYQKHNSSAGIIEVTYGDNVKVKGVSINENVILVKYDAGTGEAVWAKTVSQGSARSVFNAVAVDSSGNIYAAGYQYGTGVYTYGPGISVSGTANDNNVVLVKYDPNGNALWAKTVSQGASRSSFNSVAVDSNGNVYAAGEQYGGHTYTYGPGVSIAGVYTVAGPNIVLVKYDTNGVAQWAKTTVSQGNADNSLFNSVAVDSNGDVYAAGKQYGTSLYTYGPDASAQGTATNSHNVVLVKYQEE
jgi:hypothetical protein